MDPQDQNEILAKKIGWRHHPNDIDDLGERIDWWSGPWMGTSCPKFTTDLNDIQQVLIRLSFTELTNFVTTLYDIIDQETRVEVGMEVLSPAEVAAVLIKATAAQKTEALLRMFGLWKESPDDND